ncbi:hypothetical protein, partial [Mesorhizobium sp.]|uniref:hypothetical protein n=1 Tax=Mesorhizobium sp. TaxID=1871066 RepID=UPI0025B8866B
PLRMELVDRVFEEPLVIHAELLCRKRRRRLRRFGLLEPTYGPGQGSALSYVKLRGAGSVRHATKRDLVRLLKEIASRSPGGRGRPNRPKLIQVKARNFISAQVG